MSPPSGSPMTNRRPPPSASKSSRGWRDGNSSNGRRGEFGGAADAGRHPVTAACGAPHAAVHGVPMEAGDGGNGNGKRQRCAPPQAAARWRSHRATSSDMVDLTSPDFDDDRDKKKETRRDGRDDDAHRDPSDVVDLTSPDEDYRGDRKIGARDGRDDDANAAPDSGAREHVDDSPDGQVWNGGSGADGGGRIILAGPPPTCNSAAVASRSSGKRSRGGHVIYLLDSSDDDDADEDERARKLVRTSTSEGGGSNSIAPSHAHPGMQEPWTADRTASPHRTTTSATAAAPPAFATSAPELLDSVPHSLSHDKKREHFDDARRPERRLQREIDHLYSQRPVGRTPDTPSGKVVHSIWQQQMDELQSQLHETRKNAARDIFNRNNSAGTMGRIGADGELVFDFHGFYVKDAISHFDESLLPILPVQNDVRIITGRGKHSGSGRSVLRDGLLAHIQRCGDYREGRVRCHVDPRNEGRIVVRWIDGA